MSTLIASTLAALSEAVGQHLKLDAEGECCLAFDEDVEIVLAWLPARALLTLRAPLVALPDTCACMRAALELNYARLPPHAAIALDPLGEAVVLFTAWDEAELEPGAFVERVCAVVAAVPAIRDHLMLSVERPALPWQVQGVRTCP